MPPTKVEVHNNGHVAIDAMCSQAIDLVDTQGYALPHEIRIDGNHFNHLDDDIAGEFVVEHQGIETAPLAVIYLNPHYNWQQSATKGSTQHILHPIIHELGHAAHYLENPYYFICQSLFPPPTEIASMVSPYAESSRSAKEFVAEAFVKRVLNKPISQEVMSYYHSLNGPLSNRERSIPRSVYPEPKWA